MSSFNVTTKKNEVLRLLKNVISLVDKPLLINNSGLIAGNAGLSLFFSHLHDCLVEKKYIDSAVASIESAIEALNTASEKGQLYFDIGTGVSGLGFSIQCLINQGILSKDEEDFLEEIDTIVIKSLQRDLQMANYDNIYGFIGKGQYLITRGKSNHLLEMVDNLYEKKTSLNGGSAWIDHLSGGIINLGLAHGIPSIIIFLLDVYKIFPENDKVKTLIIESFITLESIKKEQHIPYPVFFPHSIDESELDYDNNVTWSYGDIGISLAYIKAGKILNDNDLIKKGIQIALGVSERTIKNSHTHYRSIQAPETSKDFKGATYDFPDVSFIKGTAGVAHIFNRIFQLTDNTEIEKARNYWMKLTLENTRKLIAVIKTKEYDLGDEASYFYDFGLIEGVSGVGMVLLSTLYPEKTKSWDTPFLTHI